MFTPGFPELRPAGLQKLKTRRPGGDPSPTPSSTDGCDRCGVALSSLRLCSGRMQVLRWLVSRRAHLFHAGRSVAVEAKDAAPHWREHFLGTASRVGSSRIPARDHAGGDIPRFTGGRGRPLSRGRCRRLALSDLARCPPAGAALDAMNSWQFVSIWSPRAGARFRRPTDM